MYSASVLAAPKTNCQQPAAERPVEGTVYLADLGSRDKQRAIKLSCQFCFELSLQICATGLLINSYISCFG